MNRKHFLSSVFGLTAFVPGLGGSSSAPDSPRLIPVQPAYLRKGDTVGITAPAGFITVKDVGPATEQLKNWGFRVKNGATIGKKNFGFGGTDAERIADFQAMLDDDNIRAILCARGGYGVIRIIDKLNFSRFVRKPKWIIGFSDITILLAHIDRNYAIAGIHSKMCNSFPENWDAAPEIQKLSILSIRQALSGEKMLYEVVPSAYNKPGNAEGVLVGGNLKLLETLSGTDSDLYTNGKILFVEDTGEYLYSIDRMFWNLKRTGKLVGLKGLIIGGFKIKPDDPGEEFGISLEHIVLDKLKEYSFPVCFDFPVGHQVNNFALKCGVTHRLSVNPQSCILEEIS